MTPKRPNADGDFLTDDDHLDAEVLTKDLPWVARGPAKDFIESLNKLDVNKDGKDDVAQLAPLLKRAVPFLAKLVPLVNWRGFLNQYVDNPVVVPPENRAKVKACVAELQTIGDEVAKLQPPTK